MVRAAAVTLSRTLGTVEEHAGRGQGGREVGGRGAGGGRGQAQSLMPGTVPLRSKGVFVYTYNDTYT